MVLERVARLFGDSQVTSFWCFTGSSELPTAESAAPPSPLEDESHGMATTFALCTGPGVKESQVSEALSNNLLVRHWAGGVVGEWEVSEISAGQFTITWSAGEGAAHS